MNLLCRGRVEPLPNEAFLTAAGRQMPGQRHLSAFAVLLHTLKLVAYAMLCLAITSDRSYAQVCPKCDWNIDPQTTSAGKMN